jgi:hypothetical protein
LPFIANSLNAFSMVDLLASTQRAVGFVPWGRAMLSPHAALLPRRLSGTLTAGKSECACFQFCGSP